ncbi:PTS sugar transporter subunit IIC [Lacticaseibacillus paracasei]|uniref:PTS sugar transporter subunit IIC n=1 Tax=Lacticaseibacillus paracasei TaxID=1597 RepID=UPI00339507F8
MDTNSQSKFGGWVNRRVMPPIMKFVNTKAIKALQDGMIYSLPFIIVGSVFLILSQFPIPAVAAWMTESGWGAFFSQAYTATFGVLSLWAVVGMAYVYVRNEGFEALPAGLTSLSAFLLIQLMQTDNPLKAAMANGTGNLTAKTVTTNIDKLPQAMQSLVNNPVTGVFNITWLGGQGMVGAIIVGLLTGWAYSTMLKKGWKITLPEQVPSSVAKQFTAMIPAGVILSTAMLVYAGFKTFMQTDLLQYVYKLLEMPMQGLSDSFLGAIVIGFAVSFFWFFGVHGGLIVGTIAGVFLMPNTAANAALYHAGKLSLTNGAHIVTNEFYNNFINLTGSGITIGLVVFTLIAAKSTQMKTIGKIELIPAIFNINEPFLFGLPMVMNPFLAIPFFLTPIVVAISTYAVIYFGIVPPLNGVAAPWTTPAIISGFFIGGWKMAIWQACTLGISTLIYFPFAKKYDQILLAQELAKENSVA